MFSFVRYISSIFAVMALIFALVSVTNVDAQFQSEDANPHAQFTWLGAKHQSEVFDENGELLFERRDSGGGPCTDASECNDKGICNAQNECECEEGWAGSNCKHERKSRLTAFLLALLVGGTGAARFYLGYTGDGVGKILLVVLGLLICCCSTILIAVSNVVKGFAGGGKPAIVALVVVIVIGVCCLCIAAGALVAAWAWWLADWIMILGKDLDDSDGYALEDDF